MWSRSLHATADLFGLLKTGEEAPDPEAAAEVGVCDAGVDEGQLTNAVGRDMLLRMPGVAPGNVHSLMEAAGSLAGLADLELAECVRAVGSVNGAALHSFLHATYRVPD